jgi:MFS family permease
MNLGHVRALAAHRAFGDLLRIRLFGQVADGLLQAGLVGVVLFAPERAASPTRIAVGFAVLLLPFTLLAPVAGVLLDRWSRVAVLRWANLARTVLIAVTALATASGASELVIFGTALVALALNRLVLAALGASLPRTIPSDLLVSGNALAPTVGTFVSVIGGGIGLALRGLIEGPGDAAPFLASSIGYLFAAHATASLARQQLGPARRRATQPPLTQAWNDVRAGAQQISRTVAARRGLQITTVQRVLFGGLTVWSIVVIRFVFAGTRSNEQHALAALASVAFAAGIGLVVASVVAPSLVRRLGARATAAIAMGAAAVGCLTPLLSLRLGAMLVAWCFVALGAQSLKITVDTLLQMSTPDDLRGRVFIAYDLVFNLSFMLGVAAVAALPLTTLDGVLLPTAIAVAFGAIALAVAIKS